MKETYVARIDIEIQAESQDEVGGMVNNIIGFIVEAIEPEHYQWRIVNVDDGLDDANLEKEMAQAREAV